MRTLISGSMTDTAGRPKLLSVWGAHRLGIRAHVQTIAAQLAWTLDRNILGKKKISYTSYPFQNVLKQSRAKTKKEDVQKEEVPGPEEDQSKYQFSGTYPNA